MPKKSRKCLENVSRGLRPRNPEKSSKSLRNSPTRLFQHFPETLRRPPRLFPRVFGDFSGFRGRRPRETFSRLFRHFGRARETPVRGGLVPKTITPVFCPDPPQPLSYPLQRFDVSSTEPFLKNPSFSLLKLQGKG